MGVRPGPRAPENIISTPRERTNGWTAESPDAEKGSTGNGSGPRSLATIRTENPSPERTSHAPLRTSGGTGAVASRHGVTIVDYRDQNEAVGSESNEDTSIAHPGQTEGRVRKEGLLRGVANLLLLMVLSPFLALREFYWMLDTDAAVRAKGAETAGTVLATYTDTRVHEDPETGQETTTTEYFVTYRYETPDGSHTARKKVGCLNGLKKSSKVVAYYRPRTDRLPNLTDTALDWNPRKAA